MQEIQQVLPTSNVQATIDWAVLHLRAAASLINAMEITTGAGDVKAGKEAPVSCPKNLGGQKRTRQNNLKPRTEKPKENQENIQEKSHRGSCGTGET